MKRTRISRAAREFYRCGKRRGGSTQPYQPHALSGLTAYDSPTGRDLKTLTFR